MKKVFTVFILLSLIGFNSVFAQIPTIGLVAYYPFNGNANDMSGNANNGTVHGATLTTDRFGNPNSAYSFDGLSNYIEVPHTLQLNAFPITINTWFITSSSTYGAIISKYTCLASNGYSIHDNNGNLSSYYYNYMGGAEVWADGSSTIIINNNLWHMATSCYVDIPRIVDHLFRSKLYR